MVNEEKLRRLKSLMDERDRLNAFIRKELAVPPMGEIQMSCIFGAMTSLGLERDAKLFVLIYMNAPEVLVGRKMRRGLRDFLAGLFGYNTGSAISVRCKNLLFSYRTYGAFRTSVEKGLEVAKDITRALATPCNQRISADAQENESN